MLGDVGLWTSAKIFAARGVDRNGAFSRARGQERRRSPLSPCFGVAAAAVRVSDRVSDRRRRYRFWFSLGAGDGSRGMVLEGWLGRWRLPLRRRREQRGRLYSTPIATGRHYGVGDVGGLFRLGANAFLPNYLGRFEVCGLNRTIYSERMRAVKVDEIGAPI